MKNHDSQDDDDPESGPGGKKIYVQITPNHFIHKKDGKSEDKNDMLMEDLYA